MIVAIGEITSSMLTVILKINSHLYYLLTFYLLLLLYGEILFKALRLNYRSSLQGQCVKNENLAFHSTA